MNRALLIMFLAFQISAPHVLGMSAASAQSDPTVVDDPCPPPNLRTNVRPNADGPATEVSVGVRMLDLLEINDVDQTLTVDLAILRTWKDPRLAHLEGCEIPLAEVWYPELVVINSGRLFEKWPREVSIGPDGNVKNIQRLSGTIASHHSLHDFPFDSQAIAVSFTPLKWSENEVKLSVDEKFSGLSTT